MVTRLGIPTGYTTILDTFIECEPMPYARMTFQSRFSERSKRYHAYCNDLIQAFLSKVRPGEENRKEYYCLGLDVHLKNDRGDWSNYFKAVEDALQTSRLIWNDKNVDLCLGGQRLTKCEKTGLHVVLGRREGEPRTVELARRLT